MAEDNARLIAALAEAPPGGVRQLQAGVPPNPAVVRAEKLSKLSLALRKSNKIKDFSDTQNTNVPEWLRRFETELWDRSQRTSSLRGDGGVWKKGRLYIFLCYLLRILAI